MPSDEKVEKAQTLDDAIDNALIAWGMGWDMDGVMACLKEAKDAAALAAAEAETQPVASGDEEAQCYPVHLAWSEEDEAWIATSPDLLGCCAVGDSRHEAVREMQDAIFSWIDAAKGAGRSIPKATLSKPPEWARPSPPSEASSDERATKTLDLIAKMAGNVVFNGKQRPISHEDHMRAWADIEATAIRARGETP